MSVALDWQAVTHDGTLCAHFKQALEHALSTSSPPPRTSGPTNVVSLDLASVGPEVRIADIPVLDSERFGIRLHVRYFGDASVVLATSVQANTLCTAQGVSVGALDGVTGRRMAFAAASSLVLPIVIRVYDFKIECDADVFAARDAQGVSVNLHGEPLKSLSVETTLDNLPGVNEAVRAEIEAQVRNIFTDAIPQAFASIPTGALNPLFGAMETLGIDSCAGPAISFRSSNVRQPEKLNDDESKLESQ